MLGWQARAEEASRVGRLGRRAGHTLTLSDRQE